jgi:NAD(P)-dependent dehydrogenase (short-subunit alcohol dehydrogenase family)
MLARAGAAIGIISRSEEHRLAGVAAVEEMGGRAAHAPADIREADQVSDAIEDALGPVTVLVNNAAANFPVLAASMRPNAFRSVTDIVLDGTFFNSQELHRSVTAQGLPGGAIVNILAGSPSPAGPAWRIAPRPRRAWAT